jgi:hypothetical protein
VTIDELEYTFNELMQKYRAGNTDKERILNLHITKCLLNLREQIEILKAIELLELA